MRGFVRALVAAALISSSAAASDECTRIRGFTIPLKPVEDVGYLLPVGVADTPRQFVLESGFAYTKMDETIADELKLPKKSLPKDMRVVDSAGAFTRIATVPSLKIGPLPRAHVEVLIGSHRPSWGPADGVAGANIFYGLDVELDLAHQRLGLYLPREGCTFEPFWPAVEWGSADYKTLPTGGSYLPMELDGKQLIVTLNPSTTRTYMPAAAARMLFGIDAGDPRLVSAGPRSGDGKMLFRFPFKSLSGGHNVTVQDPEIYIVADGDRCGSARDLNAWSLGLPENVCFGGGDLRLGINLLKKLHFFFTFKDKKVYFTLAEPPTPK